MFSRFVCGSQLPPVAARAVLTVRVTTGQHDRWLKVAMPMAEVLEAEGVELCWQGMKALAKAACREHIYRDQQQRVHAAAWMAIHH